MIFTYKFVEDDQYLKPFEQIIKNRNLHFEYKLSQINEHGKNIDEFSRSYEKMGVYRTDNGIQIREYVPYAKSVSIVGEFNNWNNNQHKLVPMEFGVWELFLPNDDQGNMVIPHNSAVRLSITTENETFTRIPAYINATVQLPSAKHIDGLFWAPPQPFVFQNSRPDPETLKSLRIYEAHVGMATEDGHIGSYREFADNVLPHIADTGYNCVQLMAIQEHSYYASFGYQVTSFFAPACRSGNPEDLKYLIDKAHGLGVIVIMDICHSHASSNSFDGLNMYNGRSDCYFHSTESGRGLHSEWNSRLFDFGNYETEKFLLSNTRYWLDVFHFDGFRFDAVTSLLYHHHGVGVGFTGAYHEYFGENSAVDYDGLAYLRLMNHLVHNVITLPTVGNEIPRTAITIAEDVSGMPGMGRSVQDGGVGFDYRLAMALPDTWIKYMKLKDEDWDMGHLTYTLQNTRSDEAVIAYAESHDQALVGDKTLAFWLMDKEMYSGMSILQAPSPIVERGISLLKLIRSLTMFLGGKSYLNFMGNEFGHPEWIDFPTPANGWSHHYCRRQWGLKSDGLLRYQHILHFDRKLMHLDAKYRLLEADIPAYVVLTHNEQKLISFDKKNLLFIFNFHPSSSFVDHKIPVRFAGKYTIVFHSDEIEDGGHDRIKLGGEFFTEVDNYMGQNQSLKVYIPSRCLIVLERLD
eukprot:TRINITY_DN568_c0_g1_i1.p1 TRINITY_DN568_c0_g1~~TRINITY_DN568_c0_g1_i1.p1  ORF type:complete len:703 (-),score=199.67 TRINITY_DN568_c0_g1_i1:15-2084(-)